MMENARVRTPVMSRAVGASKGSGRKGGWATKKVAARKIVSAAMMANIFVFDRPKVRKSKEATECRVERIPILNAV